MRVDCVEVEFAGNQEDDGLDGGQAREATGVATCWNADVVATAKRDLLAGEMLDGEGGYTVWGKLLPAPTSLQTRGLPRGLAHNVRLLRAVKKGQTLRWDDVAMYLITQAYQVRREIETMFAAP